MSAETLAAALAGPRPVLMDGAMGTELTRRGAEIGTAEWVSSTLELAGEVSRLHKAYADAGARLHIANTFAAGRRVLASLGQEARFEAVNRAAVDICREAIGDGWIAGSISTYVVGSDRANLPRGSTLRENVAEQAQLLADAGCDALVLEMLFDAETSIDMISAAATAALPVSAGLTCVAGPDGEPFLRGEYTGRPDHQLSLEAALPKIVPAMPDQGILTLMHSDLDVTDSALEILRRHWTGPIGIYPNSGRLKPPNFWDHEEICTPETFVKHARGWMEGGLAFVGGCCGIGPDHIAALSAALTKEGEDA